MDGIAQRLSEPLEDGLGQKLRLRRKLKGLSLQEVALRSGVSLGQLSHVERGLSMPSLRSLRLICAALDMPMGWLFEDGAEADSGIVVRASARRRIDLGAKGMAKELLTPDTCPGIQMMRVMIRPGGSSGERPYNNAEGSKCALVLSGQLGLEVDGQVFKLNAGDSFAIESQKMLRFWCEGSEPCELIWTVTPAYY